MHNRGIRPFTVPAERLFRKVPCYSDWFRYVQWHDLAMAAVERMNIPLHDIYYEDYTHNYNATVRQLNAFLELDTLIDAETFVSGKTYRHVFSYEDVQNARELVKYLATKPLWNKLQHYFDDEQFGFVSQDEEEDNNEATEEATDDFAKEEEQGADREVEETSGDGDDDGGEDDDEEDSDESGSEGPEVVWLLSFPNSVRCSVVWELLWCL